MKYVVKLKKLATCLSAMITSFTHRFSSFPRRFRSSFMPDT